jgi:hypothetical protein
VTPGQSFTFDVNEFQTFVARSSDASETVLTWQLIPINQQT